MTSYPQGTIDQMRMLERIAIEHFGIPENILMENAGRSATECIIKELEPKGLISLCIGPGNNGGDGLVCARHLFDCGYDVEVVLCSPLEKIHHKQLQIIKQYDLQMKHNISHKSSLIVDALLGSGSNGAPRGNILAIIDEIAKFDTPKFCIDLPTGFDCENNIWHHKAFANAVVCTLGIVKPNMIDNQEISRLFLSEIGIPRKAYSAVINDYTPPFAESTFIEIYQRNDLLPK
jgi:NAD(P)H-hydrate epimerase